MATKALLVGCNYPGSSICPLQGCIADVDNIADLLVNCLGFAEDTILKLVDDGPEATEENFPSKENIEACLTQLVQEAQPGDALVFYFAGHGGQIEDDGEEHDGYDECIFAADDTHLTDDDLRNILINLPEGVKCTCICDSCHSGTLLDQTEVAVDGPKEDDPQLSEDAKCCCCCTYSHRCMDVCQHLSQQLGCEVCPGNIRIAIACCEQDRCSAKYRCIWDYIFENIMPNMPEDCCPADLFAACCEQMDPSVIPPAGKCGDCCLPPGPFTLITGCQSHELSGDSAQGGVMTSALCNVVRALKEVDPEAPVSARTVVHYVREVLCQNGECQCPCLECCEEAADEPFVLPPCYG